MSEIKITLPDGSKLTHDAGVTVEEVAYSIGKGLGRASVAGEIDGELVDLKTNINEDVELSIITIGSEEGLDIYRHTAAHVMAQAVKRLYGDEVKLAIGPTIENGFYYDFDIEKTFSQEDLLKIEKEMKKIIKEDLPIERELVSSEEALEVMKEKGEDYKVELIEEFDDDHVSLYHQGEFTDLCRGPHLPSTGKLKAYKLLSLAGAYWRGDENNKMLQRIYGTAFPKKSELNEYLERLEEAKKRDHRKIGKELDLFSLQDEGRGFPFFHPKGMVIRNQLIDFWKEEHRKAGYKEIMTPVILNQSLWKQSGHWEHYQDNMYFTTIDDEKHAVKPMNCPGGILIYKNTMHSYRDLPIRMGELGLVHRHEMSGTLHGLMRVRNFTQDDAH
ncbi:MAG: threonine--tRNA ligase, partial [Halanaerobiales bacterium]